MDRVTIISGTYFDFGKYPKSLTTAAENANREQQMNFENSSPGG